MPKVAPPFMHGDSRGRELDVVVGLNNIDVKLAIRGSHKHALVNLELEGPRVSRRVRLSLWFARDDIRFLCDKGHN